MRPGMATAAARMQFPLPPWHHYMHQAACQRRHSSRTMTGAGRAAGEPPEMAWSYIGRFGQLLQYCSLALRAETLERIFSSWNERKLRSLPSQLRQMFLRAQLQEKEAGQQLDKLFQRGRQLGMTEAEVCYPRTAHAAVLPSPQSTLLAFTCHLPAASECIVQPRLSSCKRSQRPIS